MSYSYTGIAVTEDKVKNHSMFLCFKQTQPNSKVTPHEIPGKSWELICTDLFSIKHSNFLCAVD